MRIKKLYKNEYILSSLENKIWVRNFTLENSPYIDINHLLEVADFKSVLTNEIYNNASSIEKIDVNDFNFPNCVIVSDGYKFAKKQDLLSKLPKNVTIFGVNNALKKWTVKRQMNFFVINNPYNEALTQLPINHTYFPRCIISTRTNHKFAKQYKGHIYRYAPVPQENYSYSKNDAVYKIDDYRNPICAAIGLSYRFKVKKFLLFCCDEAFERGRPGAEQLENGLWQYPQHRIAHNVIDANLYWLKTTGIQLANHSSGANFNNATYISEEDIVDFFEKEHDG
jgi:hypothetical protein